MADARLDMPPEAGVGALGLGEGVGVGVEVAALGMAISDAVPGVERIMMSSSVYQKIKCFKTGSNEPDVKTNGLFFLLFRNVALKCNII